MTIEGAFALGEPIAIVLHMSYDITSEHGWDLKHFIPKATI